MSLSWDREITYTPPSNRQTDLYDDRPAPKIFSSIINHLLSNLHARTDECPPIGRITYPLPLPRRLKPLPLVWRQTDKIPFFSL